MKISNGNKPAYLRAGRTITLILLFCAVHLSVRARHNPKAEWFISQADSAIEAGELNKAETFTNEALALAIKEKDGLLESKVLVNLISIKIEQENSINIDKWYDRALQIVSGLKDSMELANLWNIKARHLMYNQRYDEARSFYRKVGTVYKSLGKDRVVGYYYNDLGYLEEAVGNHQQAADWYLKAIRIFEQTNDRSGLANTLGNIANTYFNLEEREKAIDYALQSVRIRKQTGDKEGIAIVMGNIARIYLSLHQVDSARYYQEEYIRYAKLSGKKKTLTDSYANLAMMHHAVKQYAMAVTEMKNAIASGKEINHPNLVNFYRMCALFLGKMDKVQEMEQYYDSCYALLKLNNNNTQYRDYYATRMNYAKSKGDFKNAFEYYEQYISYKDAVMNEDVKKKVAQYEIEYETQKKNAQIATEKKEKLQQQLYYNLALGILVVILMTALVFFNRYKYRKKLEQKNILLSERNRISAELHDEVGSSLSAVHLMSYAAMNQSEQAAPQLHGNLKKINANTRAMMESISDIVWSMNPGNDQLPHIITRMKVFAADILDASGAGFEMKTDDQVLPLSLSPEKRRDLYLSFKEAVNNASKYARASHIVTTIKRNRNMIEVTVTDNGLGFDTTTFYNGNGLKNMRQRMEKHGGSFSIISTPGKGTAVKMSLPYAS